MLLRACYSSRPRRRTFVLPPAPRRTTRLQMMPPKPGDMTPESMRQAADALKTLKPDQIQQMLKEVEDGLQRARSPQGRAPVHKSTGEATRPRSHLAAHQPRHAQDVHEGHEGQPQRHQDGPGADGQDVAAADEAASF